MNCRDTLRLLNGYVDDELDLGAALAIEEHLRACRRCRREEAGLRALRAALRLYMAADAAPDALRARLRGRYGNAAAPDVSRRRIALALPAAAALAAVVIGWRQLSTGADAAGQSHARVVFHIAESDTAAAALRTLNNHLEAAPGVEVVVVAHNNGVAFLLRGARDETGELYETAVRRFAARGVQFRVCNNTLVRQHIDASRLVPDAALVSSGIVEIGRLQSQEGYAYMKL